MRHEFTDHEWAAIKPMLPNKPRGVQCERPPCPERHLLGLAIGAPWRDLRQQLVTLRRPNPFHTLDQLVIELGRTG
jgi:transposase